MSELTRRILPQRRRCETFNLNFGGLARDYAITVGYYDDGSFGEVFITGAKSGEQIEAVARDGAVLISLALQHGVSIQTLAGAITRNAEGEPQTVVGAVLDYLLQPPQEQSNEPSATEP